jgi:hypothetical protein
MRKLVIVGCLLFVAVAAWRIGERLSPDAIGMAIGVLFGILAGIPTALLVLASSRRRGEADEEPRMGGRQRGALAYGYEHPMLPQQSPVIILAGNGAPMQMMPQQEQDGHKRQPSHALPGPTLEPMQRQWESRIIGGSDESWE